MVEWKTVILKDGRQRYHAIHKSKSLNVYDWRDGYIFWNVYDELMGDDIACGKSKSADEAKRSAEQVAYIAT